MKEKLYNTYKIPVNNFFEKMKNCDANIYHQFPIPHIPGIGINYGKTDYKVLYVGIETYGWDEFGCLKKEIERQKENSLNNLEKFINYSSIPIENYEYLNWYKNRQDGGYSVFWDFVLQFHLKLKNKPNDSLKRDALENVKEFINDFAWANSNAIERFGTIQSYTKSPLDNKAYQYLVNAAKELNQIELMIDSLSPDLIVIMNWTIWSNQSFQDFVGNSYHKGEDYKLNFIEKWVSSKYSIPLYCTYHPRSMTKMGYNYFIENIINDFRKNVG